jgi:hypothetical protein
MKGLGNRCDLLTIPGGIHGMGAWDKLHSDYREQMIAWLQKQMPPQSGQPVSVRLKDLGADVTQQDNVMTKVSASRTARNSVRPSSRCSVSKRS